MEARKERSMEFAVAAFSAVAGVAVSKLSGVKGRPNADARSISDDLNSIKATMLDHADDVRPMSFLRAEYFAQLRALACDIEDCIDCFNAKMTTDDEFANEIARLKESSKETTRRIKWFGFHVQGAAAQEAAVAVPAEIQNLQCLMRGNHDGDYLNCLLYFCLFPPNYHVRTQDYAPHEEMDGRRASKKRTIRSQQFGQVHGVQYHQVHPEKQQWEGEEMPAYWRRDSSVHLPTVHVREFHTVMSRCGR